MLALEESLKQMREHLKSTGQNIDEINKDHGDLETAMEKAKGVMEELQSRNVHISSTLAKALANIQKKRVCSWTQWGSSWRGGRTRLD